VSIDDLKVGMRIRRSEVSEVLGVHIVLKDWVCLEDDDIEGEIVFMSDIEDDVDVFDFVMWHACFDIYNKADK